MVNYGRFKKFKANLWQDWFNKEGNIQKLKEALPDGAKYLGAYLIVNGTADYDFEIWYELDNWNVLEMWRNHTKWYEFYEEKIKNIGVFDKWTRSRFLRTIHDVIVFEPKPSEE